VAKVAQEVMIQPGSPKEGIGKVMQYGRTCKATTVAVMWDAETNQWYYGGFIAPRRSLEEYFYRLRIHCGIPITHRYTSALDTAKEERGTDDE
jgi:hypothetical protein